MDMLVMAMLEIAMELANATGKDLGSNHSPTPLRRSLPSLTNLTCRMMMIMMMVNPQRRRKVPPYAQIMLLPANSRRRSVLATERQTFQLSQYAWHLLAVWKKGTDETLTRMQIVVLVGKRSYFSMILTKSSQLFIRIQKVKQSHCLLYQQLWVTLYQEREILYS
jgi:hypothetical protein